MDDAGRVKAAVDIAEVGERRVGIVDGIAAYVESCSSSHTQRIVAIDASLLGTVARSDIQAAGELYFDSEREVGVVVVGHVEVGY